MPVIWWVPVGDRSIVTELSTRLGPSARGTATVGVRPAPNTAWPVLSNWPVSGRLCPSIFSVPVKLPAEVTARVMKPLLALLGATTGLVLAVTMPLKPPITVLVKGLVMKAAVITGFKASASLNTKLSLASAVAGAVRPSPFQPLKMLVVPGPLGTAVSV